VLLWSSAKAEAIHANACTASARGLTSHQLPAWQADCRRRPAPPLAHLGRTLACEQPPGAGALGGLAGKLTVPGCGETASHPGKRTSEPLGPRRGHRS
jgi:hypothetical protein